MALISEGTVRQFVSPVANWNEEALALAHIILYVMKSLLRPVSVSPGLPDWLHLPPDILQLLHAPPLRQNGVQGEGGWMLIEYTE